MRRIDWLAFWLLIMIAGYGWWRLQPPQLKLSDGPSDQKLINLITPWRGPIEQALAQNQGASSGDESSGKTLGRSSDQNAIPVGPAVKGATSDRVLAAADELASAKPHSLLPVERYQGPPLTYSLNAMLAKLGVTVNEADVIEAWPDPELGLGSTIDIYRATPVVVTDWGKDKKYWTWHSKIGDFLDEAGLELGNNDRIEPPVTASLKLGGDSIVHLTITRVAITELKIKEKIDFKKIQKDDPDRPRGQIKVTLGAAGERTKTFRVTRENGVEVRRELIKNELTKPPSDELTLVGTKVLIGKSYTGLASWYKYDSTKVASDLFKRGVNLRITNLDTGKQIFVKNDGCICSDTNYVVDLNPEHFRELGGKIADGVMKRIKVDEILN